MNIVIIGAGAVGRGLLAPLLLKSRHAVTFVESNHSLVEQFQKRIYYPMLNEGGGDVHFVGPCRALVFPQPINSFDAIFVSVRVENLESVGNVLALVLSRRRCEKPLPIIVCENTPDAAGKLAASAGVWENVFYRSAIAECIIPETPPEIVAIDPLLTYFDPNGYLIVDSRDWRGERPEIANAHYSDSLEFDWDLKWHCHCTLHAVVGLLGRKAGHVYVHEAMNDKIVFDKILALMGNVQRALEAKYSRLPHIQGRIEKEFKQLKDSTRPDTCVRVTRDIARKIQPNERLMDTQRLIGGRSAVIEEAVEYAKTIV